MQQTGKLNQAVFSEEQKCRLPRLKITPAIRNLDLMIYQTMTATELAERLEKKDNFRLIDVREPVEYQIARLEEAELLPMTQFYEWIDKLNPEEKIVVMCHHGIRSANVCLFLVRNGFEKVYNLEGGIDAWSAKVDAKVPRY